MPELPEVETMVRDLSQRLVGNVIESADVFWDRLVAYPNREHFEAGLRDRTVLAVRRRGKFALFDIDGDGLLAIHRGMTGSLLLRDAGAPADRFVRAVFRLRDSTELRFDDSRKFGRLFLVESGDKIYEPPWTRLGLEPLEASFDARALRPLLARRTAAIKTVLLSQKVVAGVGNIYADEALFRARIHPTKPAGSLSRVEVKRLCLSVSEVLSAAVEQRGTTFSTYRDVEGNAGNNQSRLQVFHRHGESCPRCGTTIARIVLGGRGTHFCPRCQRKPLAVSR